jgi:flagellar biosynthesis protein FlhB
MNQEDYEAKNKVSPGILASAMFNTQLERDKQLLTLSSSAIALLVTLLRTVGVSNLLQIGFFSVALFAFLVTVILVLEILKKNGEYIDQILQGGGTENKYIFLDKFATLTFIIGIVMVIVIGIDSARISLSEKDIKMNKNTIDNIHFESVETNNDIWRKGQAL